MSNRHKIIVGIAVSSGLVAGLAFYIYLRRRQRFGSSSGATPDHPSRKPASLIPNFTRRRGYDEITVSDDDNEQDETEPTVRFKSDGANVEVQIPGGGVPLSPDQARILTRFLYDADVNDLHKALTNISNAATFRESQINLTNAGCIVRLRELLYAENETTQYKALLALNNLSLNEFSIIQFTNVVPRVIELYQTTASPSVRLYSLYLLVNLSVLDNHHEEYFENLNDLISIVSSTLKPSTVTGDGKSKQQMNDEALQAAKILVNLSANRKNLSSLLQTTNIELKQIIESCSPTNSFTQDTINEDILLRYFTFYCNVADAIIDQLDKGIALDKDSYPNGSLYHEFFDHDKQVSSRFLLRPVRNSNELNVLTKRLKQAYDTIRHKQFDSSVSSLHDELNADKEPISKTNNSNIEDYTSQSNVYVASPPFTAVNYGTADPIFQEQLQQTNNFDRKEIDDEFDKQDSLTENSLNPTDEATRSTSNHSLASFRSAHSTELSPSTQSIHTQQSVNGEQPSMYLSPLQSPEKN
ncbi:unnamed protein product [Didymodactylos carnosus]|uniref:Armadillo repeat-containing domain-containing protein n=1 Tax=Didymodactylos carnosus TaxID=1234261 RepID=A0A814M3Y1_9BILA|nr:unnamed protein product [Didymodactylos carnosus]CAF3840953.1 unnamed protein product [Didymodactylos carnosus]